MTTKTNHFQEFADRMRTAGSSEAAIRSFQSNYESLLRGETGMIPEADLTPIETLPHFKGLPPAGTKAREALARTVLVKLNGGLGTSMGLEKAKSLLEVRDGLCFLDVIARHVLYLREKHGVPLRFLLMNSFSTSQDSLNRLGSYPALGQLSGLELLQNQVPKVDASNFQPIRWPSAPQLEWCPPGHGDIYPSLLGSGWLDRLLAEGMNFLFVSNSDNLGATLDLQILEYFAQSGMPFLMEVAARTPSDRKGGHLARRGDKLVLRESAQCPEADLAEFQNIDKHRFFNTNNLWIRLDALRDSLRSQGGFIALPLIKNAKTVDPRDKNSPAVFQLESAMGAAIECFPGAGALVVPRARFVPVKTTSDLFVLRSDAYRITEDWRIVLNQDANAQPPQVNLDPDHYRLVDQLDQSLVGGIPSLKACAELSVKGPVIFDKGAVLRGKVTLENPGHEPRRLAPRDYGDCKVNV
jgi:UDP-N-acetylglucosamine pyrophosphorylase